MKTLLVFFSLLTLTIGSSADNKTSKVDQKYVWFDVQNGYNFICYCSDPQANVSGTSGKIAIGYLLHRKNIPAINPFRVISISPTNQVFQATLFLANGQPTGPSAIIDIALYK